MVAPLDANCTQEDVPNWKVLADRAWGQTDVLCGGTRCRILLGVVGFYWALWDSTGRCGILLGVVGFYWVHLP